jgi:hypothetical protein
MSLNLNKSKQLNIFVWNPFELAYEKTVQFEGKYGHKKFGKDKF